VISQGRTQTDQTLHALAAPGRVIFSLSTLGLGIETLIFARSNGANSGLAPDYKVIPLLPWLPTVQWLGYLFGAIVVVLGACLLLKRGLRSAALILGALLFVCGLILDAPKYAVHLGDMGFRTIFLEPLGIAALAWLLPGRDAIPTALDRASRYILAVCLIVFGVDHFLALAPIGTLIPKWIPLHVFWIAFFGAVFIASAISIALDVLLPWGAAGLGLMFGIWVITLHGPRVIHAWHNPDEWSSMLIAVAYWGGPWALAGVAARREVSADGNRFQLQHSIQSS
jgi:uncharacterized membrane protein